MKFSYFKILSCLFIIITFSSCFSSMILSSINPIPEPNYYTKVNNACIDSLSNIYINFEAQLYGSKKNKQYNLKFNLDSLQQITNELNNNEQKYHSLNDALYDLYIENIEYENKTYLNVVFKKTAVNKNWINNENKNYSPVNMGIGKDVFGFFEQQNGICFKTENKYGFDTTLCNEIIFKVENKEKTNFIKYLLLPPAFIIDIVTFPIQILIGKRITDFNK